MLLDPYLMKRSNIFLKSKNAMLTVKTITGYAKRIGHVTHWEIELRCEIPYVVNVRCYTQ